MSTAVALTAADRHAAIRAHKEALKQAYGDLASGMAVDSALVIVTAPGKAIVYVKTTFDGKLQLRDFPAELADGTKGGP